MDKETVKKLIDIDELDLAQEALAKLAETSDLETRISDSIAAYEAGIGEP